MKKSKKEPNPKKLELNSRKNQNQDRNWIQGDFYWRANWRERQTNSNNNNDKNKEILVLPTEPVQANWYLNQLKSDRMRIDYLNFLLVLPIIVVLFPYSKKWYN